MNLRIKNNPNNPCPAALLAEQTTVGVTYVDFAGQKRQGSIEINQAVAQDVRGFFELALELQFPIEKVVRSSDAPYFWNDDKMMANNATSGFNYREIADIGELSNHAFGRAIDVNTRLNPYIRIVDGKELVLPEGTVWNPNVPGTLTADHPLVQFMESRGWSWGGNWTYESMGAIDYQHFEKPI